jgi:hypothetical protein
MFNPSSRRSSIVLAAVSPIGVIGTTIGLVSGAHFSWNAGAAEDDGAGAEVEAVGDRLIADRS